MYSSNPREHSSTSKKQLTPKSKTKLGIVSSNPLIDRIKSSISFTRSDSKNKIPSRPTSTKSSHGDKKLLFSRTQQQRKKSNNSFSPVPLRQSQKSLSFLNSSPSHNNNGFNSNGKHQSRGKSHSPVRLPEKIVRQEIFLPTPKHFNMRPRQIKHTLNCHPHILSKFPVDLPKYEPARFSDKSHGSVRCYSACTNQGIVRQYNEDRVAIMLKKTAYFGVFDGHGGDGCSNYLRDKLVSFVFQDKNFLSNIPQAINQGFHKCQMAFLQFCRASTEYDRSGSCAIAVFIHGDMCYVSNVGDSRAIMSSCKGERVSELSIDHKPTDQYQQKRVMESGGRIYQTKLENQIPGATLHYEGADVPFIMGPHRVLPGRLSITRSFGDIEAKLPQLGGNPRAVIATPQIRSFRLTKDNDFIIIASDGIYDRMTNEEVIELVWQMAKDRSKYKNVHQFCGLAAQSIIKYSIHKRTQDNVTVVMIGLQNLQKILFPQNFAKPEPAKQVKRSTSKNWSSTRLSKMFDSKEKQKPSLKSSRSILEQKKVATLKKPTTPKGRPISGVNGFHTQGR